jgi:error-prone DNA polymerase
MVHPYRRRRQGVEKVIYPSPSPQCGDPDELQQVLGKTMGVPLFQEQAMRIAIVAAGFTPAEADKLRRAMAKLRPIATLQNFSDRAGEMTGRGYHATSPSAFTPDQGFGEYGFPSHARSCAARLRLGLDEMPLSRRVRAAALNNQPMGFLCPRHRSCAMRRSIVEVRPIDVNHSPGTGAGTPVKATCTPAMPGMADDLYADHARGSASPDQRIFRG